MEVCSIKNTQVCVYSIKVKTLLPYVEDKLKESVVYLHISLKRTL